MKEKNINIKHMNIIKYTEYDFIIQFFFVKLTTHLNLGNNNNCYHC